MNAMRTNRRDWGEPLSLLVMLVLFLVLRNRYMVGGPGLMMLVGIALAAMCALSIATTLRGWRAGTQSAMRVAAVLLTITLLTSLTKVVYLVVYHASDVQGVKLLETALTIWVSNVVLFAVIYHAVGDREFVFPRLGVPDEKPLCFLDYLFLSFTTSTAFSPTDTPPLTTRTRMFMMIESTVSLATIAIAAARAVNILS